MSDNDNDKSPADSAAVEAALSQIPGLAANVAPAAGEAEPAETEDSNDSAAVEAALSQIPGLRDQVDG